MNEVYIKRMLCLLYVGIAPNVVWAQCDECYVSYNHYWVNRGDLNIDWSPFLIDDPDLERVDQEDFVVQHAHFMGVLGLSSDWQFDIDGQMEVSSVLFDLGMV